MEKKQSHLAFGKYAEQAACDYLMRQGLQLLRNNYRCLQGEIDIIMQDKDDIVFVEVRARGNKEPGSALESITQHKIKKVIKTAKHFLLQRNCLYTITSRFDVVTLQPRNNSAQDRLSWKIEWIKNAFWEN